MSEHRFKLQPYTGRTSRYACPACGKHHEFTRYLDVDTGELVGERVGKCNRESNCGYHYTPKQYFADHQIGSHQQPARLLKPLPSKRATDSLSWEVVERSLGQYSTNAFVSGLAGLLTEEVALHLAHRYYIGTTKDGGTIFWQVDERQVVRTGKVIHYDAGTLKRCKQGADGRELVPQWAHTKLVGNSFQLQQCLFGQHLLASSQQSVAIVEAEKTAVLCSVYMSRYLWLATGGCAAPQFKQPDVVMALHDREVLLFPDTGATEKWAIQAKALRRSGLRVQVREDLEAPELARPPNWDLADEFLAFAQTLTPDASPLRWALTEPGGYPVFWDYDMHTNTHNSRL